MSGVFAARSSILCRTGCASRPGRIASARTREPTSRVPASRAASARHPEAPAASVIGLLPSSLRPRSAKRLASGARNAFDLAQASQSAEGTRSLWT